MYPSSSCIFKHSQCQLNSSQKLLLFKHASHIQISEENQGKPHKGADKHKMGKQFFFSSFVLISRETEQAAVALTHWDCVISHMVCLQGPSCVWVWQSVWESVWVCLLDYIFVYEKKRMTQWWERQRDGEEKNTDRRPENKNERRKIK